jgi:hypothetical protein
MPKKLIDAVRWRDTHGCWTGAMRTSENYREARGVDLLRNQAMYVYI